MKIIYLNFPKIEKKVKLEEELDIRDVPIVTYCQNSDCKASEELIDKLYESKVNNVLEWKPMILRVG